MAEATPNNPSARMWAEVLRLVREAGEQQRQAEAEERARLWQVKP